MACQRSTSETVPGVVETANHPPVIRAVSLRPVPIDLNAPVTASVEAQDLDRNALQFRYEWTINGKIAAGQSQEQLPSRLLKQGDRVSVQAWAHDGHVEGTPMMSPVAVVGNSPPVATAVEMAPDQIYPGAHVRARAIVADADGDEIHLAYRWWKNGKLVREGDSAEFEMIGFVRGDSLVVEVIPSDAMSAGAALRSTPFQAGNSPPTILSNPPATIVNNRFEYQVRATDVDAGALTFALETAPPGMQINSHTGLMTWAIQSNQVGLHKVRVVAKDSEGGVAFQEFELDLTAASPTGA